MVRARMAASLYNIRSLLGFTAIAVVTVLAIVLGRGVGAAAQNAAVAEAHATEGLRALREVQSALTDQRWRDAQGTADRAALEFEQTGAALGSVPVGVRAGLAVLPPGQRYKSARHLAAAGQYASRAASIVAGFADRTLSTRTDPSTLPTLLTHASELLPAFDAVDRALDDLSAVEATAFPGSTGQYLQQLTSAIPALRALSREGRDVVSLLPGVLGSERPREYLILLQNAAERRPTGGFIGSILAVRFDRGTPTVTDSPERGPFAVDELLPPIQPPNPILRVTNRWTLHDSNWSVDFPTAAAKALAFYQEARGYTVDGVLGITSSLLPELLQVTGPVTLQDGTVLTADTALGVLQERVEFGYDRSTNRPKAIIGQLFVALSNQLQNLPIERLGRLASVLREAIPSRQIQLFSADPAVQSVIVSAGWSGAAVPGPYDSLAIVGANLGGGKSDRVIDDAITVGVSIDPSGAVTDTVAYLRSHRGVPADPLAGSTNRSYLRFLAPSGSQLRSASGLTAPDPGTFFAPALGVRGDPEARAASGGAIGPSGTRILAENGFASFGGWLDLPAQSGAVVRLTYTLPTRIPADGLLSASRTYRLRLLHQGGTFPSVLLRITLPKDTRPVLSSLPLTKRGGAYEGSLTLGRDTDITVLYR